ncbi:hypothetical protein ABBQ38_012151 [Trebouxia sp. C0009 RCD-2024]
MACTVCDLTGSTISKGLCLFPGAAIDTSCGTKLNTDRDILAAHPDWHAEVVDTVSWLLCGEVHKQWLEAVVDSGIYSRTALQATAERYEDGKFHGFMDKLRDAAARTRQRKLSSKRGQQLIRTFCQGWQKVLPL